MGMGVTRGRESPRVNWKSGVESRAVGLVGIRRPLEVDEVLQHRFAERRQPDYHVGRQAARDRAENSVGRNAGCRRAPP